MPVYSGRDRLAQIGLIETGFLKMGTDDGYWGPKSEDAYRHWQAKGGKLIPRDGFPVEEERELNLVFGIPDWANGNCPNTMMIDLPYPMKLSWMDVWITRTSVNKVVADSLLTILQEIKDHYGEEGLKKYGLNIFGGICNVRKSTMSNRASTHSWGIAIDINPLENGNRMTREQATMPVKVCHIFEKHGWMSGGRAWGRDYMHFQATARPKGYPSYV